MKIRLLIFLLLFEPLVTVGFAFGTYPADVEIVLNKSGKNRPELEKAIRYFQQKKDPLKLKAIYFLITNMDIHYSSNYRWVDASNKEIPFNEFKYPNYKAAKLELAELKRICPTMHPTYSKTSDVSSITGDFLIDNVERAFRVWRNSPIKNISFNNFCEYILPYRVSNEPLQSWRGIYQNKFQWVNGKIKEKGLEQTLEYVSTDCRNWFKDTWGNIEHENSQTKVGPLTLLFRKEGECEEIAQLQAFTLRSQGVPVSLNIIPFWATSTYSHSVNSVFNTNDSFILYDASKTPSINKPIAREPSKVIRITYSKQPNTLASLVASNKIPSGFMRLFNYVDITDKYWPTADVKCNLLQSNEKIAYISVFNGQRWSPTWWSRILNNSATFTSMAKGAVFLPGYYVNGKMVPAAYPIALGYNHQTTLKPDIVNRRDIILTEQDKYLKFRPGKWYRLLYWDNVWKTIAQKKAENNTTEMKFANVPRNALLLLIPEYTKRLERPFMITDDGKRVWW